MNRPDFSELVTTFKGGSLKGVGFQPTKLGNFDGIRDWKVVDSWFGGLYSCHQGWATFGRGTCPILFEGLCFHMVEDGEARRRKEPLLHMGIL